MHGSKVYLMFLNLPMFGTAGGCGVVLGGTDLGGMEHPFFDILSPGLTGAPAVMYQGSSGREGNDMREVR